MSIEHPQCTNVHIPERVSLRGLSKHVFVVYAHIPLSFLLFFLRESTRNKPLIWIDITNYSHSGKPKRMLSGLHFKLRCCPLSEEVFLPLHFIFYQSLKFQCVCKGGVRMEIYLGVGCLFYKKDGRWKAKWFSAEAQGQPHPRKAQSPRNPQRPGKALHVGPHPEWAFCQSAPDPHSSAMCWKRESSRSEKHQHTTDTGWAHESSSLRETPNNRK